MPEGVPLHSSPPDMSDPDASSLLCKLCQTLVVRQDKTVWHDRFGWRMNVSYTRHDSFPALPVLNMLALQGCSICEFLIAVIRRAVEEEIRDNWPKSVANARARPLVLKLLCIELSTMRAKEDTYPSYMDGELLLDDTCKRLCIGFVRDGGKAFMTAQV